MTKSNSTSESFFPSSYPDFVYNFSYGANMFPNVLTGRRKIHPIESIPGVLEGWQLTFDLRGIPALEPCFGNIKENPDAEVHGILHKMTGKQFKYLLTTEGGSGVNPNGYIPNKVNVHAYDGRIIEAYTLVVRRASPSIASHHVLPSARYMGLLRNGATHHKIHPLYIEYLQSLPSFERSKPTMILVIFEILLLIILSSPIWIPVVLYYVCTNQKVQARAYFFSLIMVNSWRIYRFFGANRVFQPYYSAPFPLGSTNFKENTETFRTQVQIDEQTLPDTVTDILPESNTSSAISQTTIQRKNS
ncbi:unnamed protein product [Adineta steineri]|uniref:gamma-glutamylcyclotransferase n=1 Tax=Adineta steineri TaxID=433720 RepID=A0A820EPC7_9BILA|nr:unnamed protein product [Adineta steineri]